MNRPEKPPTIGVLAPYTGGFYYGAILAGVHGAARARGARVVAFQTTGMDLVWPDEPGVSPLGLQAVDGWLAVNDFGRFDFTARLSLQGIPLVYLSERPFDVACCSVLPDNHGGMKMAVRHLIEHGHRKIAFAGYLGQFDLRERYEGYLDALHEAGLEADPDLLFWGANNLEIDGNEIGRKLARAKLPCTALVAGTDKTALGILEALRSAGYRVPEDLALVGFDDIEKAQYTDPPLTTVRQRFDLLAARATETLLEHLETGVPLPETVRVPTAFITRTSCGCSSTTSLSSTSLQVVSGNRTEVLARSLLEVASSRNLSSVPPSAWPELDHLVNYLDGIAIGNPAKPVAELNGVWSGFLRVNRDVEAVEQAMTLLEDAALAWCPRGEGGEVDDERRRALSIGLRHLRIELMRGWRTAEQDRNRYYDFVAEANGKINHALTGRDFAEARDLSWLRWTRLRYGCLSLWSVSSSGKPRRLRIVSEYGARSEDSELLHEEVPPELFPPPFLQSKLDDIDEDCLLMVVAITGSNSNHGLLTVAGPIEVELLDHGGSIGDWAALLGASLERETVERQLRENALRDALTGLPNRALLMERLEHMLGSAEHPLRHRFAVLFLDLDDFKRINDSLGHLAGDQLLIEISERLSDSLRDTDTIARLGGDEFAVLVPNVTHESDALEVVSRIQEALRAPFNLDGHVVFTSCSIGVALSSSQREGPTEILRNADTAMYRAKLEGPARHEIFHHGMHTQAVERLRLDSKLRHALERGEFILHYQPLVSLRSGHATGAEALIRWNHPQQGSLLPQNFLAVAEEMGLAVPISKWVIETACREVRSWQLDRRRLLYVNVNVPAQHLKDPGFTRLIDAMLTKYSLPPKALGLELVESTLIEHQSSTVRVLEELQELGVRTAIDDFGTGYSSLSYLKRFPINTLKIDRAFIDGVPHDPFDASIAKAIIAMAHGLGLTVVAEGVEREEQIEFLRGEHCDAVQGYLLSRPLDAAECRSFLLGSGRKNVLSTDRVPELNSSVTASTPPSAPSEEPPLPKQGSGTS